MSVYKWCTECAVRVGDDLHKQHLVQHRADFQLGGRHGVRIRKLFPTKDLADDYERATIIDYKRGLFIPTLGLKARLPFSQFADEYFEKHVRLHLKGASAEKYRLRAFKSFWKDKPLHTISANDFTELSYEWLAAGHGKTTVNRKLTSIKAMFQWAVANNYLLKHPFSETKKFKVDNVRVRWLNDSEIETLLHSAVMLKDFGLRDILLVALNTGFRKANLVAMSSKDIISGHRLQATKTKSGNSYDVPINQVLREALLKLCNLRSNGPLLNFTNLRKRWKALIDYAKLDTAVTLHTLRHTFAAQCLKRGVPIDVLCKWLGHFSIEFTRVRYGHLCPNKEAELINQVNLGGSNESIDTQSIAVSHLGKL